MTVGRELAEAIADLRQRPEIHVPRLFDAARAPTPSAELYFSHYGLDLADRDHQFGSFDAGPYRLAAHIFRPRSPRGTVIALHGYLDHSGMLRPLVHRLSADYAVALFDLPGHGLSTGERASIGDFDDYADTLAAFLALCRRHLPGPYHLVGHSTGGAVILSHVLMRRADDVAGVVLLAPLVHSYAWRLTAIGQRLTSLVTDRVPRVFRTNSSDTEFLRFVREDPLQIRHVPFAWQRALRAWDERIKTCSPRDKEALVVQGSRDTSIDLAYNERFLRRKLPRARSVVIDGARHHLVNEARPLRDQVLDALRCYLASAAGADPFSPRPA